MKQCLFVRIPARLLGSSLSALALLALAPAWYQSAAAAVPDPKLMFERSSVVGNDNAINAYGVPISNASGVIKYYDVTVTFTATGNGSVPTMATVTGVPSPIVGATSIVAGNYKAASAYKASCAVTNNALQTGGRTQSLLKCTDDNLQYVEITLVNGAVDGNHPFYTNLQSVGIDKRADKGNYIWGLVTAPPGWHSLGGCSFMQGNAIGAQQVGKELRLSIFPAYSGFKCTGVLFKVN